MSINKYFDHPVAVAAELFSAGWCNLHCKYCYIPKADFLKDVHKVIIEKIESGEMISDLKEIFGKELTDISHWGTEPTLTTGKFKDFYKQAIEEFPNLKNISLSSNFMTNPENLVKFVLDILPKERVFNITMQVSLDGPAYITDANRLGGATDQIIKNCLYVTKELNARNKVHKLHMHLKPTIGADNIKTLSDFDKTEEYYDFFDDFMYEWVSVGNNIDISRNCDPTLVTPSEYTAEDGRNFYKLILNQIELKKHKYKAISSPESNYFERFRSKLWFYREFHTKHRMFTCSAGDSQMGIGDLPNSMHSCHRSFYLDNDKYINAAKEYGLDNMTLQGIDTGRNDVLADKYIVNTRDDKQVIKMLYLSRAHHDFTKHRLSFGVSAVLELARAGQVSKCYNDPQMALMLAYFSQVFDCPMDDIVLSGSTMMKPIPTFKIFGNGVFENILSRILKIREYTHEYE